MTMPWWGLLIEVFVVWLLWGYAAVVGHAASGARRGVPEGRRGGVSLAPIIPALPLTFWGTALIADLAIGPWGTIAVGWLHVALGFAFVASIVRDRRCLRSMGRHATPGG